MPKKEKFAEPWKEWTETWKELTHPTRPCKKNIQDYKRFFEEAIKGRKLPKALVFGATPELRDLLAEYPHLEVTVVDINMEMILAMTELMRYKEEAKKEIWVKADWLKAPLKENYYDVLLGDYVLENLAHLKQPSFFKKAFNFLKKRGYCITRFYARYPESKVYDFKTIVQGYTQKKLTSQNFEDFWTIGVFQSNLRRNYTIGINLFLKELKKYTKDQKVKKLYEKARRLLPKDKEWTYFDWQKDKWMIERYFVLEKRASEPSRSPVHNWGYILKLRKK